MLKKPRITAMHILIAAIFLNFFTGLAYIWSIIGKQLMEELHWTSVESSMPYTVFTIAFAVAMTISGPIQDKIGPRIVATLGSLLVGLGLTLTGFALKPVLMVITFGIMTGFGIGSIYAASVPPALKWFPPEKKGTINGIIVAMVALASVMYSPLTRWLMNSYGIAPTFWIIGGGLLVILTGFSLILSNPPAGHVPAGKNTGNSAPAVKETHWKPSEVIKEGNFYKMWFMFLLSASSSLMVIGHAANIAQFQAGWDGGFILVILLAVFNGIGRSYGGTISDKIGRPNLMRLTFLVQAVNMFLFSLYTNYILLMVGVAIAGICYGATMVVFSTSTADLYGMKNFGANYGMVFTAWGIAGVLGPIPGAMLFDAFGSFTYSYLLSGVLVAISLIISLTFHTSPASRTRFAAPPADV